MKEMPRPDLGVEIDRQRKQIAELKARNERLSTIAERTIEAESAAHGAEAERDRMAALLENWLPSLHAVHEGEYNEYTGKVLLTEDQWTGISEAEVAFRAILEKP